MGGKIDKRDRIVTGVERRILASGKESFRAVYKDVSKTFDNADEAIEWRDRQIIKREKMRPSHPNQAKPITSGRKHKDTLTNAQLDGSIAAILWEENARRRDQKLYDGSLAFASAITPKDLSEKLGVTAQRAHASLLRLEEFGIATKREKFDRDQSKVKNVWSINEGALVRYLLAEIQKEKLHEKLSKG